MVQAWAVEEGRSTMAVQPKPEVKKRPGRRPRPIGILIDQKGIQEELGILSRDVIRWCMAGRAAFPKPLRIVGRIYIFERAAIFDYFGLKDQWAESGGKKPEKGPGPDKTNARGNRS
jgi:hypothetical protein